MVLKLGARTREVGQEIHGNAKQKVYGKKSIHMQSVMEVTRSNCLTGRGHMAERWRTAAVADNHTLNDTNPRLCLCTSGCIGVSLENKKDGKYHSTTARMENHSQSTLLSSSPPTKHRVKEHFSVFVIFFPHFSQQPAYLGFLITHSECGGWDLMELAIVGKNKSIK